MPVVLFAAAPAIGSAVGTAWVVSCHCVGSYVITRKVVSNWIVKRAVVAAERKIEEKDQSGVDWTIV